MRWSRIYKCGMKGRVTSFQRQWTKCMNTYSTVRPTMAGPRMDSNTVMGRCPKQVPIGTESFMVTVSKISP